jgi:hypothetical protein
MGLTVSQTNLPLLADGVVLIGMPLDISSPNLSLAIWLPLPSLPATFPGEACGFRQHRQDSISHGLVILRSSLGAPSPSF